MDDDEEEDWDGEEGRNGGRRSSIYFETHTTHQTVLDRLEKKQHVSRGIRTQNADDSSSFSERT